ncbi:sigma-70 family RNA polymerase sigma factor [Paenibacillus cellulositrophicus]|uniref:sigma-70 family RNA polymerase sigma factor n=1 Tax=Paenibacillus cellulositrophicus TaxID=562959 RepID=UPI003F7F23EE
MEDKEVVKSAKQGDLEAYSALVSKYSNAVYATAFSVIGDFHYAQDIAQEAFVKAWSSLGMLDDLDKFGSWLFTITKRLSIDWLRKRRDHVYPLSDAYSMPNTVSVEEVIEIKETKENVWGALMSLDEKYRQIIVMYFISGFNSREISQFLSISLSAAESRIRRSKELLKKELFAMVYETLSTQKVDKDIEQKVMKRITGVACINIPVKNVEKSVEFYINHLGCELVRGILKTEDGGRNAFIKLGNGPVLLLHQEKEEYNIHFMRNGNPAPMFELITENVKGFFKVLQEEGVKVIGDVEENVCGDRIQVCDPDGNRITIIQI